jgi:hypothetical protein
MIVWKGAVMEERTYRTMGGAGALNIVLGAIAIVVGVASGVLLIISGAKLISGKSKILF